MASLYRGGFPRKLILHLWGLIPNQETEYGRHLCIYNARMTFSCLNHFLP